MTADLFIPLEISLVIEYGIAIFIFGFAIYGAGTALEEMIDKIITTFKKVATRVAEREAELEAEDNERQALMERLAKEEKAEAELEALLEAPVKTRELKQQVRDLLVLLNDKEEIIIDLVRVVNSHTRISNGRLNQCDQNEQLIHDLKQRIDDLETEIGSSFRDMENDMCQQVSHADHQVSHTDQQIRHLENIVYDIKQQVLQVEIGKQVQVIDVTLNDSITDSITDSSVSSCSSFNAKIQKIKDKRDYRNKYYDSHRTAILEKQKAIVKCPHCAKSLARASLPSHMKAEVCKRARL